MHQSVGRAGSPALFLSGGRYYESVSSTTPVSPPLRPTIADGFRSGMPWLLVGAACAFGLAVVSAPYAALIGLGLAAVALVRRRADAYAMFTIGFAVGIAILITLVIFKALTDSPSSGSDGGPGPGPRP